jgi:hypothetical protein
VISNRSPLHEASSRVLQQAVLGVPSQYCARPGGVHRAGRLSPSSKPVPPPARSRGIRCRRGRPRLISGRGLTAPVAAPTVREESGFLAQGLASRRGVRRLDPLAGITTPRARAKCPVPGHLRSGQSQMVDRRMAVRMGQQGREMTDEHRSVTASDRRRPRPPWLERAQLPAILLVMAVGGVAWLLGRSDLGDAAFAAATLLAFVPSLFPRPGRSRAATSVWT